MSDETSGVIVLCIFILISVFAAVTGLMVGESRGREEACKSVNKNSEWYDGKCVVVSRVRIEGKL